MRERGKKEIETAKTAKRRSFFDKNTAARRVRLVSVAIYDIKHIVLSILVFAI